jgi:Fe-S-cluster-containing hydrogenase component 2
MLTSLLFDRIVSETESAKVRFLERRCLRSRFNRNRCRSCLDECQAGALTLDGRKISFNQEACTGCMRCASVCPNDAFDGGIKLTHLLETLGSSNQVVLTCSDSLHFQPKLLIPCIGFLSEPLLAAMNSVAQENFYVDVTHCHDCNNSHCLSSFYEKMEKVTDRNKNNKLIALKNRSEIHAVHSVDGGVARRSYLRFAKKSIIDLGREAVCPGQTNTISSQKHADKGPVMASILLYYAYKKSPEDAKEVLRSYFYTVKVTGHCNLCPGCQGMCPTGALKRKTDGEGEKRLMFISSACSGCGLCRDFCKRNAIKVTRGIAGNPGEPLRIC